VLGCTHYPLISQTIAKIIGTQIKIIDPAITACEELKHILQANKMLNTNSDVGTYKFYVTDVPVKFQSIGERFLNHSIEHLEVVSVE
jgi:glutamate racemase